MRTSKSEPMLGPIDMDGIVLRNATGDDVAAIVEMLWDDEQGRQRESISRDDSGTYLSAFEQIDHDPNSKVIVAAHNDVVIGCMQLTIIPGLSYRGIRRALVEDVRVARPCRNHGIGGLLLAHAEAMAAETGCQMIELFVHAGRTDAHRFYEKAGYIGAHRGFRKILGSQPNPAA